MAGRVMGPGGAATPGEILTERLRLVAVDASAAAAVLAGEACRALPCESVADGFPFAPGMYGLVEDRTREEPAQAGWLAWAAILREGGELVGDGGFHGPPDDRGTVALGYSVAPAWRGRGLAREMAAALLAWAFAHDAVRAVEAETLEGNLPSQAILRRLGFAPDGRYDDLDDGPVLRWRLDRPAWESARHGTREAGRPAS